MFDNMLGDGKPKPGTRWFGFVIGVFSAARELVKDDFKFVRRHAATVICNRYKITAIYCLAAYQNSWLVGIGKFGGI